VEHRCLEFARARRGKPRIWFPVSLACKVLLFGDRTSYLHVAMFGCRAEGEDVDVQSPP